VIKIDFYHDVVCGWCFVIAPRLRKLSEELPLEIRHRSFVLQDSREEMVRAWGSLERAKREILGHWSAAARPTTTRAGSMSKACGSRPSSIPRA
jgi:predicted DsbA family dithiol-disulfide isomerase